MRNPVECGPTFVPDAASGLFEPPDRNIYCRLYNRCLWDAEARNWEGFACTACSSYEAMTEEEARDELVPIAALVFAIYTGRGELRRPETDDDDDEEGEDADAVLPG